jgi:hypothetical protein
MIDVLECRHVRAEDARCAHLDVAAGLKAVPYGQHTAANAILPLEHDHLVAPVHQPVRRGQAGEAAAEDCHALAVAALAALGPRVEAVAASGQKAGTNTAQEL